MMLDLFLSTDWTLPSLLACFVVGTLVVRRWVRQYHDAPVDQPTRPDRHLPADEYRLLGDDYRECVADFMGESFIRHTRNRFAIYSVTGADPEKSESRDVSASGPLTSKEPIHASENQ